MKTKVTYRLPTELKNEFNEHVQLNFGKRRTSFELEKAMKLYLAIFSDKDYDDIEIQSFRSRFNCAHTQNLENGINESKRNLQRKVSHEQFQYRDNKMDQFVSAFKIEYGRDSQVSISDLSKLVMRTHGVCDKRSIQNRVEYLVASDIIEPYAPNVFNIRL